MTSDEQPKQHVEGQNLKFIRGSKQMIKDNILHMITSRRRMAESFDQTKLLDFKSARNSSEELMRKSLLTPKALERANSILMQRGIVRKKNMAIPLKKQIHLNFKIVSLKKSHRESNKNSCLSDAIPSPI